jgi:hypothetical protein
MSALILYITRQVERTAQSTKRLRVLMVLLIIIAAAGAVLLFRAAPNAIEYPQRFITPTPAAVCPGETFTYPVVINVDESDTVSRITEGWCRTTDGICPRTFQMPEYYVNFLDGYAVSTTATRTVPMDLPPGDWEMRHCNETHSDGRIDVTCYAVAIEVKDCEVKP